LHFSARTDLPPNPIVELSDRISQISAKSKNFIALQQGEMAFETPKEITNAAYQAAKDGFTRYAPALGFLDLRIAIANKLKTENGIDCDSQNEILVTEGSTEALFVALGALLEAGDEAILLDPSYAPYDSAVRATGATPIHIPSIEKDDWLPSVQAIEKAVNSKTRLFLVNTPNNPTGEVYSPQYLKELCALALRHNITVLSDEAYEALLYDGQTHVSPGAMNEFKDICVSAFSFSKTYAMTGWRLGYLQGPAEFIRRASVIHNLALAHVSSPVQMAGLEALRLPKSVVRKFVDVLDRRKKLLVEELNKNPKIRCRYPKGTFYAFPDFSETKRSSLQLADRFLEAGVGTSPGAFFGSCADGNMRLCFATVNEEQIVEAVRRISNSL